MKFTVQLEDNLAEKYAMYATELGKPVEEVMAMQLGRFESCNPLAPYTILSADTRQELEKATNGLPLRDGKELISRVRELASIRFGAIYLALTPPMLREIEAKAKRWGLSVEAYVDSTVRRILEEHLLSTVPRAGEMVEEGKAKTAARAVDQRPPAPAGPRK